MPYKDKNKQKEKKHEWYLENKEKCNQRSRDDYNTNKEYYQLLQKENNARPEIQQHRRKYRQKYYQSHRLELIEYGKKYYQEHWEENKEHIRQRNTLYRQNNRIKVRNDSKALYKRIRIGVLTKINPELKCMRCGCDIIRLLEINHKNGGGSKESKSFIYYSLTLSIHYNRRKTDDLELLCAICNKLHWYELLFKTTDLGFNISWEYPKSKIEYDGPNISVNPALLKNKESLNDP